MGQIKRSVEEIKRDIEDQSKVCCICLERKTFADFYNFKNKSDGKSYRCKSCDNLAKRKWMENNPDKFRASQRRNLLWTSYRLTPEDYSRMLSEQNGCCAVCDCKEEDNKIGGSFNALSVDHNHITGKVRGLLCNQCNRGIGMLQDSADLLTKAARYLKENN